MVSGLLPFMDNMTCLYLGEWAIAVHGMYESPWFNGFLFRMLLVESSFPTDTGCKDPFVWIAKPSTFVKYLIKFVEGHVKNNKSTFLQHI